MKKRGISPLIATVLIISFVILLGVVVMTWGEQLVEKITSLTEKSAKKELTCLSDVDLEIQKACYDSDIKIWVENKKAIDLEGDWLLVEITKKDGSELTPPTRPNTVIKGLTTQKIMIPYDYTGNLIKVSLVPRIKQNGEGEFCKPLAYKELTKC